MGVMGDFAHAVEFSGIMPRAQNRAGRRRIAATAMIFVPCRNGISHNEAEPAAPEHCAAGLKCCSTRSLNSIAAQRGE
jgi:hypothetical protein